MSQQVEKVFNHYGELYLERFGVVLSADQGLDGLVGKILRLKDHPEYEVGINRVDYLRDVVICQKRSRDVVYVYIPFEELIDRWEFRPAPSAETFTVEDSPPPKDPVTPKSMRKDPAASPPKK